MGLSSKLHLHVHQRAVDNQTHFCQRVPNVIFDILHTEQCLKLIIFYKCFIQFYLFHSFIFIYLFGCIHWISFLKFVHHFPVMLLPFSFLLIFLAKMPNFKMRFKINHGHQSSAILVNSSTEFVVSSPATVELLLHLIFSPTNVFLKCIFCV